MILLGGFREGNFGLNGEREMVEWCGESGIMNYELRIMRKE
jgi:hypothetical protein